MDPLRLAVPAATLQMVCQPILYNGVNIASDVSQGFTCATCHDLQDFPDLYTVNQCHLPRRKCALVWRWQRLEHVPELPPGIGID